MPRGEEPGRFGLTKRQAEMADLLSQGLKPKQIATKLGLSPGTVDITLFYASHRLGCSSALELAMKWRCLNCRDMPLPPT